MGGSARSAARSSTPGGCGSALSVVFFLGLVDRRRILSWHTVDLLALLSFGFSLLFFNRGHIFMSASLGALPLAYLARPHLAGSASAAARANPALSWPVWLLAGACRLPRRAPDRPQPRDAAGRDRRRLRGRDRRRPDPRRPGAVRPHAGHDGSAPAARPTPTGAIRDHIQTNGRCESANARGDTYGPTAYLAYVPAVLTLGWSGKWDSLPAAHATSIAFDLLAVLGLFLVGRRFGGTPLGAALAFGWVAFPFTAYALNSNSNDTIMPAILVWGFWLSTSAVARGATIALAGWTKFAALLLAPLWLTYPNGLRPRTAAKFAIGVRRRDAGRVLDPALRAEPDDGGARLRRPHARLPARPRLAVLALGLGPVPRARDPEPPRRPGGPPGRRARARRRRRGDPAAQGPARARRAERRRARRLRAHADPLVVPLHPVVPAVRPARAAAAAARAGSDARAGSRARPEPATSAALPEPP